MLQTQQQLRREKLWPRCYHAEVIQLSWPQPEKAMLLILLQPYQGHCMWLLPTRITYREIRQ